MTEELEVLTIVTGRLEGAGIAYMVTGSFAANYYAVPRMTRDIDLVVELSAGDTERFCALFEADFYLDRDAVGAATPPLGLRGPPGLAPLQPLEIADADQGGLGAPAGLDDDPLAPVSDGVDEAREPCLRLSEWNPFGHWPI